MDAPSLVGLRGQGTDGGVRRRREFAVQIKEFEGVEQAVLHSEQGCVERVEAPDLA
jgi:hypothetical protein